MKVIELFITEAPIEDFNLVGDWNKSSSFRHAADRKILTSPKVQDKIIRKWLNTPVPFSLNFVNSPGAGKFLEQGEVTLEWLHHKLPQIVDQLRLSDDAVNIVFTNNTGAERAPMTAWIIAHRFGHALQRWGKNEAWKEYQNKIEETLNGILVDAYGIKAPKRWDNPVADRRFEQAKLALCHAIGTFRSARTNNIRNVNEFILEVLAQYITTGTVKFNPVPRSFGFGRKAWGRTTQYAAMPGDMLEDINHDVEILARDSVYYLDQVMHSAVGRIYVM